MPSALSDAIFAGFLRAQNHHDKLLKIVVKLVHTAEL